MFDLQRDNKCLILVEHPEYFKVSILYTNDIS